MIRHKGGQKVGKGTYWDTTSTERVEVKTEEILPGGPEKIYYRIPAAGEDEIRKIKTSMVRPKETDNLMPAGVLVSGPILGLIYAAFLPFIGIAMAVKMVGQKLAGGALEQVQSSASFGWRPSESYLTGKKRKTKAEKAKKEDKGKEQ